MRAAEPFFFTCLQKKKVVEVKGEGALLIWVYWKRLPDSFNRPESYIRPFIFIADQFFFTNFSATYGSWCAHLKRIAYRRVMTSYVITSSIRCWFTICRQPSGEVGCLVVDFPRGGAGRFGTDAAMSVPLQLPVLTGWSSRKSNGYIVSPWGYCLSNIASFAGSASLGLSSGSTFAAAWPSRLQPSPMPDASGAAQSSLADVGSKSPGPVFMSKRKINQCRSSSLPCVSGLRKESKSIAPLKSDLMLPKAVLNVESTSADTAHELAFRSCTRSGEAWSQVLQTNISWRKAQCRDDRLPFFVTLKDYPVLLWTRLSWRRLISIYWLRPYFRKVSVRHPPAEEIKFSPLVVPNISAFCSLPWGLLVALWTISDDSRRQPSVVITCTPVSLHIKHAPSHKGVVCN